MFGAQRPSWITKEEFYRTPFNYCDRWCKRCGLTEICKVFQDEQKSRQKWIKQGKNPDSWEYVFETVKESFEETMKLIEKGAKKWGIDLSKIDDSDYKSLPEPKKFPLYNLVEKFSKSLERLLKNLEIVPIEANEELILQNMEVLVHYQSLIRAKIYRALTSKLTEEEERDLEIQTFDAETSAFIVISGLVSISEALTNLAQYEPLRPLKNRMVRLGKTSLDLAKIINSEFDLEREDRN
jgi:hypothetical protein